MPFPSVSPLGAAVLSLLAACGAGEDLTEVSTGSISVIATVTGSPPDGTRFEVVVDEGSRVTLTAGTVVTLPNVAIGERQVSLVGMPPDCEIQPPNPLTLTVTSGVVAHADFSVSCPITVPVGALAATISSGGTDLDSTGYILLVDPGRSAPAEINGEVTLSGLEIGEHLVRLTSLAGNCSVQSDNPRTVVIAADQTTRTSFEVICRGPIQGRVVYVQPAGSRFDIVVRNADGNGAVDVTDTPDDDERHPDWSPDGRRIAFDGDDGSDAIYLVNPDGSDRRALSTGFPAVEAPKWSPDGRKILFLSRGDSNRIVVMNADGSARRVLAVSERLDEYGWSPDGRKVVYKADRPFESTVILTVNPDGSGRTPLTGNLEPLQPSLYGWSRDGRWIAFVARVAAGQPFDIFLLDPVSKAQVNLTRNPTMYRSVAWSPDATMLAFVRDQGLEQEIQPTDIFTIRVDGTGLTNVTRDEGFYTGLSWSPDGQRLLYEASYLQGPIQIVDADGSTRRPLAAAGFDARWAP